MSDVILKDIRKTYPGGFEAVKGVSFAIPVGGFCVLVGPSGCGKSTLLRMVAGLETITSGTCSIGGRVVNDVEPADRDIAMVFQNYALYPHMSVYDNMAYGLRNRKTPEDEIKRRVAEAAKILAIEPMLDRKPRALSGGQRQRVAIGRAIVRGPEVFLFDEPLSNLDAELRVEMRVEIARLHREIGATMIYVTHDQVEAMTLASKIVVLRAGRIEQVGAPLELYRNPDNRFVAGFIGSPAMNFVAGTVKGHSVATDGLVGEITPSVGLPADGSGVVIGLRPQALRLVDGATHRVDMTEALGGVSFIHLTAPSGEKLIVEAQGDVIAAPGTMVGVGFDAKDALFFAADAAGNRLR